MATFTTTRCDADVSPNCPGHSPLFKWPSCLAEVAMEWPDSTTGDVDGFGWWVALLIQDTAETIDTVTDVPVTIPAGTFLIVRENSDGHIRVEDYPTAEAAQAAYDDWDARYCLHMEAVDMREHAITSSTGRVGR